VGSGHDFAFFRYHYSGSQSFGGNQSLGAGGVVGYHFFFFYFNGNYAGENFFIKPGNILAING